MPRERQHLNVEEVHGCDRAPNARASVYSTTRACSAPARGRALNHAAYVQTTRALAVPRCAHSADVCLEAPLAVRAPKDGTHGEYNRVTFRIGRRLRKPVKPSVIAALVRARATVTNPVAFDALTMRNDSELAGWTGLEPAASGVTGRRYNQLNYHPKQWRCLVAHRFRAVKEEIGGRQHHHKPSLAAAIAARAALALLTHSSYSAAGSLPSTMPAPACTVSSPACSTTVRIAIAKSMLPSKPK